MRAKKKKMLEEIDRVRKLIDMCSERSGIDTDKYLETLNQLKKSVSTLDPNRESFNDLLLLMTKRSGSLV